MGLPCVGSRQAVQDFVESLDKNYFRPLQKESYRCCAAACDSARTQADLQHRFLCSHRQDFHSDVLTCRAKSSKMYAVLREVYSHSSGGLDLQAFFFPRYVFMHASMMLYCQLELGIVLFAGRSNVSSPWW